MHYYTPSTPSIAPPSKPYNSAAMMVNLERFLSLLVPRTLGISLCQNTYTYGSKGLDRRARRAVNPAAET